MGHPLRRNIEELRTLEAMRQELGTQWRENFYPKEGNGRSPAYRLMMVIHQGYSQKAMEARQEIRQDVLQFVDNDFDLDQPAFVYGFAEGALAAWDEVKDEF